MTDMPDEHRQPIELRHHDLGQRLAAEVLDPLKRTFVGKDEIIDLMGICLIGGENLFLLGPPGTAKSALVHELGLRLQGRTFEYLLTRFTEPNEIFGPFDIGKLREGELVTNIRGMLPEASLIFLDELLNANSAILNSLLTVLNERVFRRGREVFRLPLLMAVGASNHLPEEEALAALFDRFLVRVRCDNIPDERLDEVLLAGWKLDLQMSPPPEEAAFSVDEASRLQACLPEVELAGARSAYVDLIKNLRKAGIPVSDRRAIKFQRLVAASALICGRTQAAISDFWVLKYTWEREEQREVLAALVEGTIEKESAAAKDDGAGATRHPRSLSAELPDPESLAAELNELAEAAANATAAAPDNAADLGVLRDRLSILEERCQWVQNATSRGFLQEKAAALWSAIGANEAED